MTNVLVTVSGTVDVSEEILEKALGKPDDDSQEWYEAACKKAEELCEDTDFMLNHLSNDFDCDAG